MGVNGQMSDIISMLTQCLQLLGRVIIVDSNFFVIGSYHNPKKMH